MTLLIQICKELEVNCYYKLSIKAKSLNFQDKIMKLNLKKKKITQKKMSSNGILLKTVKKQR